jgi:hypothetical protein
MVHLKKIDKLKQNEETKHLTLMFKCIGCKSVLIFFQTRKKINK